MIDKIDIIKVNDSEGLKICFQVPFLIIEKIILSEETFQSANFVKTIVELLNQISLLLFRMESNGEMTLKFTIEILKRTIKGPLIDIEDK